MISQLVCAACALVLLGSAPAHLSAAEPPPTRAQLEAVRKQQLEALQKGDFAAAERYGKQADALEVGVRQLEVPAALEQTRVAEVDVAVELQVEFARD